MNRSMITATNTMSQLQKQLDTISHNLANVNTTGYKRREVNFSELLVQQFNSPNDGLNEVGRLTPNGVRQGVGARIGHTNLSMYVGSIKSTDRPLDIALTKEGQFLQVLVEENGVEFTRYTRDGSLYVSPLNDGSNNVMLVTSDGFPVLDSDGDKIIFPENAKDIVISENGTIRAGSQAFELAIAQVLRPQLLESKGNNLFGLAERNEIGVPQEDVITLLNGDARQAISIQQGALEQSNVDLSSEMSDLLITQRSYQFNAKSISISDQMMGLVNGIR
ncbi:flagellar hook-basal body protein [Bacillus timonensis]|nr:flagellar hook-basal body protein [Bacillus timonensis]